MLTHKDQLIINAARNFPGGKAPARLIGMPCMFDAPNRKTPMYGIIQGYQIREGGELMFSVQPDGLWRLRWVRFDQLRVCSPLPNPNRR